MLKWKWFFLSHFATGEVCIDDVHKRLFRRESPMNRVSITKLINTLSLVNLTPEINTDEIWLYQPEINRPALQLAGFMEHFENERVQIVGYVE